MYFFLFIIAILISIPGIIFLLLGFIHKKPGQWIPGIVLSSFAVLMVILTFVIIVRNATRAIDKNINWHQQYSNKNYYDDNYNNAPEQYDELKQDINSVTKEITGFIKGSDNKLTLITVKTDALLLIKGVAADKIETYTSASLKKNGIPIVIYFSEDFKGGLTLNAYNESNDLISSTSIDCSGKKEDSMSIEFDFEKSINFSSIKYCTLSETAAQ
jgi:hypothetical protein